jgi:cold shock CspA family protein
MMGKLTGEVRVLNVKRGFGFIAGSDRRDFFFHFNNVLKGTISPQRFAVGDKVTFNVVENEDLKKNPQAVDVAYTGSDDKVEPTFATLGDIAVTEG